MAILRDAQTGQGIATGTPLDMVVLADQLGRDQVLFDDVGKEFDPDTVLSGAQEQHTALQSVVDNPPDEGPQKNRDDLIKSATANANQLAEQLQATPEDVEEAQRALDQARKQAENPV